MLLWILQKNSGTAGCKPIFGVVKSKNSEHLGPLFRVYAQINAHEFGFQSGQPLLSLVDLTSTIPRLYAPQVQGGHSDNQVMVYPCHRYGMASIQHGFNQPKFGHPMVDVGQNLSKPSHPPWFSHRNRWCSWTVIIPGVAEVLNLSAYIENPKQGQFQMPYQRIRVVLCSVTLW